MVPRKYKAPGCGHRGSPDPRQPVENHSSAQWKGGGQIVSKGWMAIEGQSRRGEDFLLFSVSEYTDYYPDQAMLDPTHLLFFDNKNGHLF